MLTKLRRFVTLFFWMGVLAVLSLTGCAKKSDLEWKAIRQTVRQRFPGVTQISPAELSERLRASGDRQPLLLDARSAAEYAVSHLRGARLASDEAQALEALKGVPKDRPLVAYCAVGWRSSALAEKLKAQGYTQVSNLEGSIFAWANEGRPVYKGEQPVAHVHPFSEKWGRLLKEELRAPLPDAGR
jgi:rhodanese-related sulfurtransferase